MRMWFVLVVSALMLISAAWTNGAQGATMDDVKSEMAQNPWRHEAKRYVMYVPMAFYGGMHVSFADLCVSGGRLRPTRDGGAVTDMGPAPQGNQYSVLIFLRDQGGYDELLYERDVTLPVCK
jgi:hypothetical protein